MHNLVYGYSLPFKYFHCRSSAKLAFLLPSSPLGRIVSAWTLGSGNDQQGSSINCNLNVSHWPEFSRPYLQGCGRHRCGEDARSASSSVLSDSSSSSLFCGPSAPAPAVTSPGRTSVASAVSVLFFWMNPMIWAMENPMGGGCGLVTSRPSPPPASSPPQTSSSSSFLSSLSSNPPSSNCCPPSSTLGWFTDIWNDFYSKASL